MVGWMLGRAVGWPARPNGAPRYSPDTAQPSHTLSHTLTHLQPPLAQVADARVGDTITLKRQPAAEALPGYTEAMPMVFCGLFPTGACCAACRNAGPRRA